MKRLLRKKNKRKKNCYSDKDKKIESTFISQKKIKLSKEDIKISLASVKWKKNDWIKKKKCDLLLFFHHSSCFQWWQTTLWKTAHRLTSVHVSHLRVTTLSSNYYLSLLGTILWFHAYGQGRLVTYMQIRNQAYP